MPRKRKQASTEEPALTGKQLTEAALNLPADQFQLGDRVFNIVHLPYDDYLLFVEYIAPFLDAIGTRLIGEKLGLSTGVSLPGIELGTAINATAIIRMCGKQLPEMVQIICRQTDPTITVEDVKRLAGDPTPLIGPIIKQIVHNGIIQKFASFFAQLTTILSSTQK